MKMGKVPSQMTKKELTAFLLEQTLRLSKAEKLLDETRRDLRIAAKCMNPLTPAARQFTDTANRIEAWLRSPSGLCTHDDPSWCTDECRPSDNTTPAQKRGLQDHDCEYFTRNGLNCPKCGATPTMAGEQNGIYPQGWK